MLADAASDSEADRLDLDRLERRYRLVYPLSIFLENARQVVAVSAIGLVIAASVFFLRHSLSSTGKAPVEIQVFLVTAFASLLVVGYISLWALTVRNFWKLGSLLTLVLALAFAWSLYATGAQVASPVTDMLASLRPAAPFVALLLLAVIGLTAAYYAHLIWALLEAAFALTLVTAPDRTVLRDQPSRRAPGMGFLSRFWGFPPLFRFARGSPLRFAAIIVLSLLCAFLFSIVAVLPLILKAPIDDLPALGQKCGVDGECIAAQIIQFSYDVILPFVAFGVCLALGWLGQRLLRRLLRFSLQDLQKADTRPPVLFLRAFRDDQVPLREPKVALFGRVLELGRRSNSLDQLLLEEATSSGPVVGLGSPTDKRPPYGAARGYFTGETWQEAVTNLAAASDFIVICVDDTDGVWWEVGQLVDRHADKTLFLIHPRYAGAAENASILVRLSGYFGEGQAAKALLASSVAMEGHTRAAPVIGFFRGRSGSFSLLQSSTFSRFAYLMALRAFIRQPLPG